MRRFAVEYSYMPMETINQNRGNGSNCVWKNKDGGEE